MTRKDAQAAWEKIVEDGFYNYDELTKDQKIWFNVEPLTTDGIIDHYINHGAEHNQDTIEALEYLGFYDISQLMRKVNNLFANGQPPADIDERNEQWNSWCDKNRVLLDEVDEEFWKGSRDLENALMEHINATGIGIA